MQIFHVVGSAPLYTNTFLLISEAKRAVIIDPAARTAEYDAILKENNATLAAMLCTHGHFDHVGRAERLKAEWGAPVYCDPADIKGDQMYPLAAADFGYDEGETLKFDELEFTVWHTPGHTEGSVVLLCGEYLFVGDTVFKGSMGRTDLPGGSDEKMTQSLRKFAALPVPRETCVLPGHGEFSSFGEELDTNYYIRAAVSGR